MDIAAHVSFFHDSNRFRYLEKVLSNLDAIAKNHRVDVYIYSNKDLKEVRTSRARLEVRVSPGMRGGVPRRLYRFLPLSARRRVDPFFLTWNHRPAALEMIDRYDAQVYLEDDIGFTESSLEYWLKYKDLCYANGYLPGFVRIEQDTQLNKWFCSDYDPKSWVPNRLLEVGGQTFVVGGHYYGFWIYDRAELKRFAASGEWDIEFDEGYIRERAALGWHAVTRKLYKANIVPVRKDEDGSYVISEECAVHHMPNNYIGHFLFCKLEFPPRVRGEPEKV